MKALLMVIFSDIPAFIISFFSLNLNETRVIEFQNLRPSVLR